MLVKRLAVTESSFLNVHFLPLFLFVALKSITHWLLLFSARCFFCGCTWLYDMLAIRPPSRSCGEYALSALLVAFYFFGIVSLLLLLRSACSRNEACCATLFGAFYCFRQLLFLCSQSLRSVLPPLVAGPRRHKVNCVSHQPSTKYVRTLFSQLIWAFLFLASPLSLL